MKKRQTIKALLVANANECADTTVQYRIIVLYYRLLLGLSYDVSMENLCVKNILILLYKICSCDCREKGSSTESSFSTFFMTGVLTLYAARDPLPVT